MHSHGFKTSSTDPVGVAPKFSYTLTFSDGSTETLTDLVTLEFEATPPNDPFSENGSVPGRNLNDVAKVCWCISDYRIVKVESNRGNQHIPFKDSPSQQKAS